MSLLAFLVLAGAMVYLWENPQPQPGAVTADDIATLRQQIGEVQQRVTRVEQRPMAAAPDLRPIEARIAALEHRPAPAAQPAPDLAPLQAKLADLDQRLTALEHKPEPDAVSHAELSAFAGRVDALAGRADQLAGALQGQDASLSGKIAGLDGKLGAVDQRLAGLDKTAGQITQVSDRAARVARLQAVRAALDRGEKLGAIPDAPPALGRFADMPPPTEASLRLSFPAIARQAEDASEPTAADPNAKLVDRMWARAQALVTVRQGDHVIVGDPAAGVIARAQRALDAGDLAGAVAALGTLTGKPAEIVADWRGRAQALVDARAALASLEARA